MSVEDKMIIHYCYQASQPYISVYCLPWEGYVAKVSPIKEGVYEADFDDTLHSTYYTFDRSKVTCGYCMQLMMSVF